VPCQLQNSDIAQDEVILEFKESEQTFVLTNLPEKPVISILRNFSAPVKLSMQRELEELAFLLSFDSDGFNRWEAGQQLAGQIITGLIADIQNNKNLHLNPIIVKAFRQVISQSWHDLSYFSLLLSLPSESYLAEQMTVIDVEAIHKAREFVVTTLSSELRSELENLYLSNHLDESGKFDSQAIGRRRIKNTCLSYLSRLHAPTVQKWCEQQFDNARNMTDQIAALANIASHPHPEKTRCLASFYQQWQAEALVIDKWFAIQATSPLPDTFNTVLNLTKHKDFNLANPNRVRSVIGSFCQANPVHFHASNGQGYVFLADQVIALNLLNPQVASRMLGPLTSWRRFDNNRQHLMRMQLERIMKSPAISRDVYEVASKSLL
jgi:aminopeptidase N